MVGAETERLLAVNDQDGEMDDDTPVIDPGFFLDGEMCDEGDDTKVDKTAASEEKPKESHDVKFKSSPCRPNSVEVAKHDKTHLPYRSWCLVCVRAKGKEVPILG